VRGLCKRRTRGGAHHDARRATNEAGRRQKHVWSVPVGDWRVPRSPRGLCATRAPLRKASARWTIGRYPGWRRIVPPSRASKRSGADTFLAVASLMATTTEQREETREGRLATCVAVAYRCGGSTGWRAARGETTLPVSRLTAPQERRREHQKCGKCRSAHGGRQEGARPVIARLERRASDEQASSAAHPSASRAAIPHMNTRRCAQDRVLLRLETRQLSEAPLNRAKMPGL
jgi:hypothetical protein